MPSSPEPTPKRRKANVQVSGLNREFKAGNIIRLRIWNFTTYSYGVFNLSPSLNMIIGPNGTGKSTFVAAVCLGLGGKIDLIRRSHTNIMIKSGEKECKIEIVLSMGPDKPPFTIERIITLNLQKSKWKVDGSMTDIIEVRKIVKKLNIQLDNLCHFLPQERVAEFASLSPENLLLEVERTIGDYTLLERHQLLIHLDDSLIDVSEKLASQETTIDTLKLDVGKFVREVERFQEYEDKSLEIGHHKKLLPYAKLQDLKTLMAHLKLVRDNAKRALQDFNKNSEPLHNLAEKVVTLTRVLEQEVSESNQLACQLIQLSHSTAGAVSASHEKIKECKNKINNLRFRTKNQKLELQKTIEERDNISTKLQAIDPVNADELTSLEQRRLEQYDDRSKIEEDIDSLKFQTTSLDNDIELNEKFLREEKSRLDNNDRLEILRSTGTRYRKELMENSYITHRLLRVEKKSQNFKYFEAPIISCRVTDLRFAKYFEKLVDNMSLFALYFENEEQYQGVSSFLPKDLNVPMRVLSSKMPDDKLPRDQLKKLGFDGCLSDFVTGPEPVIRALKQKCFIHMIPVALKVMSPELIQYFIDYITLKPGFKNAKFAVENSLFLVSRSKHGSRQILYHTEHIAEAQLMAVDGLTVDVKREIHDRISTLNEKVKSSVEKRDSFISTRNEFQAKKNQIDRNLKELDIEVRALKKQKETKAKLENMLLHIQSKLESLEKSTTQDYGDQIAQAEAEVMKTYLESSDLVLKNSQLVKDIANKKIENKKLELRHQQLENMALSYQSLIRELEKKKEQLVEEYSTAKSNYDQHKKGDAAKEIKEQTLVGEERTSVKELAEKYHSQGTLTEQFVLRTIERLEEDISVLANVDPGVVALLKSKRADLECAQTQLPHLQQKKSDTEARMRSIYEPWVEELSTIVEKISQTFQKKFVAVASDGQVDLVRAERFKDWKLEIRVKFRENSELKVLDHQSQSGGERAVSTIFFVMSLQGLTNAPFRVVDEINQGMDPKNEKTTHRFLVNTACSNEGSQYFLVTPKLLTGLYYRPEMAVHCIFTGPYLQGSEFNSNQDYLDMSRTFSIEA